MKDVISEIIYKLILSISLAAWINNNLEQRKK